MRIVIGSDHAGFALKQDSAPTWKALGYEVLDLGPHNTNPVDSPNYAEAAGLAIQRG
jgi:ribose 5-phosphate isomerase RpiB